MRQSITAALTAGLLLLALAVPASARPDATGPTCADIDVGGNYVTDPDTGVRTATFNFELPLVSCERITYAAYVYDAPGGALLASGSTAGDGTGQVGFAFPLPDGPESVCLSAESIGPSGRAHDVAPDSGCIVVPLDAGGGLSKFG